jgi:hypothetical protein
MSDADVLSRLRRFLLLTSALLLAGTVAELLLVGHAGSAVQLLPFALCGAGLVVLLSASLRPRRGALVGLRACMVLVAAGSLYGVYEHVEHNVAFQREIQPGATAGELMKAAVGGANPLLAPGILALAAALALAATYQHPGLRKLRDAGAPNNAGGIT